jgi:hypothetical protein
MKSVFMNYFGVEDGMRMEYLSSMDQHSNMGRPWFHQEVTEMLHSRVWSLLRLHCYGFENAV